MIFGPDDFHMANRAIIKASIARAKPILDSQALAAMPVVMAEIAATVKMDMGWPILV